MKPFGEFLASLRTSAGLPLEDLALLANSSKSTISRLENEGVSHPFLVPCANKLSPLPKYYARHRKILNGTWTCSE